MKRLILLTTAALVVLAGLTTTAQAQVLTGRWGSVGEGPGKFDTLLDIATYGPYVYTLEEFSSDGRVQKFTADGKLVRQFGRPQDEDDHFDTDQIRGALYEPKGIATGPGGNVYVSEDGSDRTRISVWSPRGKFLRSFGAGGSGPGQILSAGGLAVDGAGNVYVADSDRIGVFNARGAWVGAIGQSNDSLSYPEGAFFSSPSDVALSGTRLFAPERDLVKVWNTNNTPVGLFGENDSSAPGLNFSGISSIAFSGSTLYVADSALSRVQAFQVSGNNVRYTGGVGGTPGGQPGQLTKPAGVATDCRGSVYVADAGNFRVQKFGAKGAKSCGSVAKDRNERFRLSLGGSKSQRFRSLFAVRPAVTCDRPCVATLTGSIKVKGRKAIKLRRERKLLEFPDRTGINLAPSERGTDAVVSAVRRRRKVTATVTLVARDLTGRKSKTLRRTYRLR